MTDLTEGFPRTQSARPPSYYKAAMDCYLTHVVGGQSIRAIAARFDLHPSTVSRRVRKIELLRDDPLVDRFLSMTPQTESIDPMTKAANIPSRLSDISHNPEALRALRRLCENGAFLAVSEGLEKAAVMRQTTEDVPTRTAVVSSLLAGEMVLRDWLRCTKPGRIACYEVTTAGRAALKRALAAQSKQGAGLSGFAEQHKEWGVRIIPDPDQQKPRSLRVNLRESPLASLARKRGKDGKPFLSVELVAAGERMREDFELAQIGPRVAQNWDSFLTPRDKGSMGPAAGEGGQTAAQKRFSAALQALGPGLGDIVLRCCCFLEGMEAAEKRLGWSARSGKIVLRIALQRLWAHYESLGGQMRRIG